jgi:hypothetical protein
MLGPESYMRTGGKQWYCAGGDEAPPWSAGVVWTRTTADSLPLHIGAEPGRKLSVAEGADPTRS